MSTWHILAQLEVPGFLLLEAKRGLLVLFVGSLSKTIVNIAPCSHADFVIAVSSSDGENQLSLV